MRFTYAVLTGLLTLTLTGCPEDDKRPIGGTCSGDDQCAEGVCIANRCLDPEGDEDGDGLINRVEGALGTDPFSRDTDGDGIEDGDEVGDVDNPVDTDGDGKPDAIESNTADADGDCLADQFDANDSTPETDPAVLGQALCPKVGACGASGAVVTASCPSDRVPVCDFSGVPQYQATETACDNVDNDCDGATDENHAAGGAVTFDGGSYAGDAGKVLGDACGAGACAGGTVVCAVDMATLVCSSSDRSGALTCDADNDCDGRDDLTQVSDPLSTTLAGCVNHFIDADGDGYGVDDEVKCLCKPAGDYVVTVGGDCADGEGGDDVHPNAPAICGQDADCVDGLLDAGEVCDDGNDDPSDGCDACGVTGLAMGSTGGAPSRPQLVNLSGGGFAVIWDDGYSLSERWLGYTLAIFSQDGVEIARVRGLGVETDYQGSGPRLAALSDNRLVVVSWVMDTDGYRLAARRFSGDGTGLGGPIWLSAPMEPAWDFGVTGNGGRFAAHWSVGGGLFVRVVDEAGVPLDEQNVTPEPAPDWYEFVLLARGDGDYLMTWRAWEVTFEGEVQIWMQTAGRMQLDASGAAAGSPVSDTLPDEVSDVHHARWSGGWARFVLMRTQNDTGSTSTVMVQRYTDDDTRVGPAVMVIDNDPEGCPYEVVGGFDEGDSAFALLADGECRSAPRGTVMAGDGRVQFDLGIDRIPETSYVNDLATSPSGPVTVAFAVVDNRTGSGDLQVFRFATPAKPVWLRRPLPEPR